MGTSTWSMFVKGLHIHLICAFRDHLSGWGANKINKLQCFSVVCLHFVSCPHLVMLSVTLRRTWRIIWCRKRNLYFRNVKHVVSLLNSLRPFSCGACMYRILVMVVLVRSHFGVYNKHVVAVCLEIAWYIRAAMLKEQSCLDCTGLMWNIRDLNLWLYDC